MRLTAPPPPPPPSPPPPTPVVHRPRPAPAPPARCYTRPAAPATAGAAARGAARPARASMRRVPPWHRSPPPPPPPAHSCPRRAVSPVPRLTPRAVPPGPGGRGPGPRPHPTPHPELLCRPCPFLPVCSNPPVPGPLPHSSPRPPQSPTASLPPLARAHTNTHTRARARARKERWPPTILGRPPYLAASDRPSLCRQSLLLLRRPSRPLRPLRPLRGSAHPSTPPSPPLLPNRRARARARPPELQPGGTKLQREGANQAPAEEPPRGPRADAAASRPPRVKGRPIVPGAGRRRRAGGGGLRDACASIPANQRTSLSRRPAAAVSRPDSSPAGLTRPTRRCLGRCRGSRVIY